MRIARLLALAALASGGTLAACGASLDSSFGSGAGDGGTTSEDPFSPSLSNADGSIDPSTQPLVISPADPVVTVVTGQPLPTIEFVVSTVGGVKVPATFAIDRGEIGAVGISTGSFSATGNVGGKATVTGTFKGKTVSTSVTVKLQVIENGFAVNDGGPDGGGAGGNGGVGGEGPGGEVSAETIAVLRGGATEDVGLKFLYPYDKTVWPRGILAPLLQWEPGAQGDYDAVYIKLAEASFTYEGFFAKTATPFIHHPITQAAWKQLLSSNAGEPVTVTLTFAKGGVAYGSITESWKIASAPLKGTVYYNSYGTKLAKNFGGALGPGDGKFGAATLAIKGGSTDPSLVAGEEGDQTKCRVCHSVAANGSVLLTQRNLGDYKRFSSYDLKTGAETTITPEGNAAAFAWPAIYPDGSMFVGDSSDAAGSSSAPNGLYQMPSGPSPAAATAIPSNWPATFRAAFPAFAPDGNSIAFTMFGGAAGADKRTLGMMTFSKPGTFGEIVPLYTPPNAAHTALYPSFMPTNNAIVFEVETRYNTHDYGGTRSDADVAPPDARASRGARAELWWLDVATHTAHRLDKLNGVDGAASYLPTNANGHDDDATLNYEPTVNPVPSGGYAWVVFTSRRLYGNVATINPFYSDPRFHDLTSTPTPKKLWVAAVDLNAPAGTDPSHPAFYLPAQELLAGNARGYWVVDPCKVDNSGCETGDECCGGFCRPDTTGALVCTAAVPTCAQEFEACKTSADCCNSTSFQCINGRCAIPAPR